jgi:hypothetical protein
VLSEETYYSAKNGVGGCLDSPYEFWELKGWGVVEGSVDQAGARVVKPHLLPLQQGFVSC